MALCPHNQNPIACLICFQINQKQRTQPKPQQHDPQQNQAAVLPMSQVLANPHTQALEAKKQAAYEELMKKAQATYETLPDAPREKRHKHHSRRHVEVEDVDDGDQQLDGDTIAKLEEMYPRRPTIMDRLPTHPSGNVSGSASQGGGSTGNPRGASSGMRPVTRGKPING